MKNKSYFFGLVNGIAVSIIMTVSFILTAYSETNGIMILKIISILLPIVNLLFFRDNDYLYLAYKRLLSNLFFIMNLMLISIVSVSTNYYSMLYNTFKNTAALDLIKNISLYFFDSKLFIAAFIGEISKNDKVYSYICDYSLLILVNVIVAVICYASVSARNKRMERKIKREYLKSL